VLLRLAFQPETATTALAALRDCHTDIDDVLIATGIATFSDVTAHP
jgi:hypothetical protein